MRAGSPPLPRVIIYVFASPLLPNNQDTSLISDLSQVCEQEGIEMADRVIDRGPPKSHADDYPVLTRLHHGEAEALLVVRSPLYRRGTTVDALEGLAAPGPFAWLTVEDLRQAKLLPATSTGRRPRRPTANKRARTLRTQGQALRLIGQTLTQEGYRPPKGAPWSAAQVAKLLGIEVIQGGRRTPTEVPAAASSASEAPL